MKKTLILVGMLAVGYTTAQTDPAYNQRVGINTQTPRASLEVRATNFDSRIQGILFPHISNEEKKKWQTDEKIGLVAGTTIWNIDLKCLDYFDGEKWQCTDGSNPYYPPVNTTPDKNVKAEIWDRTHYIGSFKHNGANIDGTLDNTNKLTLQIAYNEATVGGDYNEINVKRTIKDRNGKDVVLTLHIPAGTFTQAKGFLPATIEVGSGATTDTFSVKQLDAFAEELLTTFTFSINGRISNVNLIASGGVLDKNFGKINYNLIYVPVSAYHILVETIPDTGAPYEGKWLNNNLGANYANLDKPSDFNPVKQAQTDNDYRAFGSLFEWQRPADGHELVNWKSSTTGDFTQTEDTLWTSTDWKPNHSRFIIGKRSTETDYTAFNSWVDTSTMNEIFYNLWQKDGANNPCPSGYHVPMISEWEKFHSELKSQSNAYWATQSQLHLPTSGERDEVFGDFFKDDGLYWSSTSVNLSYTSVFRLKSEDDSRGSGIWGVVQHALGLPIRCVAD